MAASTRKRKPKKTTAKRTAVAKVPQPHGGALNAGGTPGNKGGTGRPPNSFRAFLKTLREDPEVQSAILSAAKDPTSRGFSTAMALAEKYDDDKPAERGELKVSGLESLIAQSWGKAGHA